MVSLATDAAQKLVNRPLNRRRKDDGGNGKKCDGGGDLRETPQKCNSRGETRGWYLKKLQFVYEGTLCVYI